MAKVLVALLRFNPKQQKELLRKVDEQVNQVSYVQLLWRLLMTFLFTVESLSSVRNSCLLSKEHLVMTDSSIALGVYITPYIYIS